VNISAINSAFQSLMAEAGKKARSSAPSSNGPVDWDAVYAGTASWGVIAPAIRELDQRLLALEGREAEAERRLSVRAEALKTS